MNAKGKFLHNVGFVILCLAIFLTVGYLSLEFGLKRISLQENTVNVPTIYAYSGREVPSRYTVNPIFWLPLHILPSKEYQEMESPLLLTFSYWIIVSVVTSKLIYKLFKL